MLATEILLPVRSEATAGGYKLSEQDRLAILSQAPAAQLARQIEEERLEFILRHGSPFGESDESFAAKDRSGA